MKYVALWLALIIVFTGIIQVSFDATESLLLIKEKRFEQPWRLITSLFAHGSIGHALSNLFALCLFGLILEGRIGPKRVLAVFIFSGLLVNILVNYERSLGASGAIFGIIGTLAILRPMMAVWMNGLPMPMLLAAFLWAIQDLGGLFNPSNVGHMAHLWGLAIGVTAGFYWRKWFKDKPKKKEKYDPLLEKKIDSWQDQYMK